MARIACGHGLIHINLYVWNPKSIISRPLGWWNFNKSRCLQQEKNADVGPRIRHNVDLPVWIQVCPLQYLCLPPAEQQLCEIKMDHLDMQSLTRNCCKCFHILICANGKCSYSFSISTPFSWNIGSPDTETRSILSWRTMAGLEAGRSGSAPMGRQDEDDTEIVMSWIQSNLVIILHQTKVL